MTELKMGMFSNTCKIKWDVYTVETQYTKNVVKKRKIIIHHSILSCLRVKKKPDFLEIINIFYSLLGFSLLNQTYIFYFILLICF